MERIDCTISIRCERLASLNDQVGLSQDRIVQAIPILRLRRYGRRYFA
jgi:hypothetical protein